MAIDATAKDLTVAVIGTGTMGRGIMQVSAEGGLGVIAFDERPGAAAEAKAYIGKMLTSQVEKGRMTAEAANAATNRVQVATSIEDLARAQIVIEAIIENLEAKQTLFKRLEAIVPADTILASNTSSIPITAIASACAHPERVGGLHFFNPVPLMKLVEVIPGLKTNAATADALMTLSRRMTREPILCSDSPGFIVNHVGRGFMTECPRILAEGIADVAELDAVMTGAPGFKLGMFALADMVGIDVGHAVMESFDRLFYGEPMFRPSPLTAQRAAGGLYGRKSGAGWYTYGVDGRRIDPPARVVPAHAGFAIWVHPNEGNPGFRQPLMDLLAKGGFEVETGGSPSAKALRLVSQVGWSLTEAVHDLKLDGARTVSVDMQFGLKGPRTAMVCPATAPEYRDAAHAALAADGQRAVVINDSPGYIAQRVVAQIINVACGIAQRGIALPADIDKGAKLGLGYPYGPFEWGDQLGAARVLFILERLHAFYGEERYRPNPWLKRRAKLGLSLATPEGRGI